MREYGLARAVLHRLDRIELDLLALVGENLVALKVLLERDVAAADRSRQAGIEMAVDPHLVGEVDDVVHALHLAYLDRRDVARVDKRRARADHAHAPVVEVVRYVPVEALRPGVEHRGERDLVVEAAGPLDVRLEGRAGLPLGQYGVVLTCDRVVAIVRRADPCKYLACL